MSRRRRILIGAGLLAFAVVAVYWWMLPTPGLTTENIRHLRRGMDWREVYYLFEGSRARVSIQDIEQRQPGAHQGGIGLWKLTDRAGKSFQLFAVFNDEGLLQRAAIRTEEASKAGRKADDIELTENVFTSVYNWLSGP